MSIVFNGKEFAHYKELGLKKQVSTLRQQGKTFRVLTFTFAEDAGSVLYTKLKVAAAERIEIQYLPHECGLKDKLPDLVSQIRQASEDPDVSGVMIQKPAKTVFSSQFSASNFEGRWQVLIDAIDPQKDIDGLTGKNHKILPATVRAVISILEDAQKQLNIKSEIWKQKSVVILGRSEIVGKPLSEFLRMNFNQVDLYGKSDRPENLFRYDIVISAVGNPGMVTGNMVKDDVIVIDVGAPMGDVDFETVVSKASFITPVPGGVGPVTVVSLMENIVSLGGSSTL